MEARGDLPKYIRVSLIASDKTMRLLITGATGFIGRSLCQFLAGRGHRVRAAVRTSACKDDLPGIETMTCGELDTYTDWSDALRNIDAVIHLASPAHRFRNDVDLFQRVIVDASINLVRQMRLHGGARLVYMSTVHVNGEETVTRPFSRDDVPHPRGLYAMSKYRAELSIRNECGENDMEWVIVRSPLVHGPRVKGNLGLLLRSIRLGLPLPLKSVCNVRSLVGMYNLCDFLETCAVHPDAVKKTYLVSDDEDVSTPVLIRHLATLSGRPARLFPFPLALLRGARYVPGCGGLIRRLCGSLQVDISHARDELNWRPPRNLLQGLQEMVDAG